MIQQILADLYRFDIPLPGSHLKALNSYLIRGDGRFLLIDTGWNRPECMSEMLANLKKLDVDLTRTDFFITHLHSDHSGLTGSLASRRSAVYFNQKEVAEINAIGRKRGKGFRLLGEFFARYGFPRRELARVAEARLGARYGLRQPIDFRIAREGDKIQIGDYCLRCIETPGHSPGHMCLYEPDRKFLLAGDHILGATPDVNIVFSLSAQDSLRQYLDSLEKVYPLDVELALPGHGGIFTDHRRRIRELKEHHQARLNEILDALGDGGRTVYQIARGITWNAAPDSWESLPPLLKFFAFGEVFAHLRYLEEEGKVRQQTRGDMVLFVLAH